MRHVASLLLLVLLLQSFAGCTASEVDQATLETCQRGEGSILLASQGFGGYTPADAVRSVKILERDGTLTGISGGSYADDGSGVVLPLREGAFDNITHEGIEWLLRASDSWDEQRDYRIHLAYRAHVGPERMAELCEVLLDDFYHVEDWTGNEVVADAPSVELTASTGQGVHNASYRLDGSDGPDAFERVLEAYEAIWRPVHDAADAQAADGPSDVRSDEVELRLSQPTPNGEPRGDNCLRITAADGRIVASTAHIRWEPGPLEPDELAFAALDPGASVVSATAGPSPLALALRDASSVSPERLTYGIQLPDDGPGPATNVSVTLGYDVILQVASYPIEDPTVDTRTCSW